MCRRETPLIIEDFGRKKAAGLARLKEMDSRLKRAIEELAFMRIEPEKCASSLDEGNKEKERLEISLENERRGFEQEKAKLTENLEVVTQEKQDLEIILGQHRNNANEIEEGLRLRFEDLKKASDALDAQQKLDFDRLNKEKDELGQSVINQENKYEEQTKLLNTEVAQRKKLEDDVEKRERVVEQLRKSFENEIEKEKQQVITWTEKHDVLKESWQNDNRQLQNTLHNLTEVSSQLSIWELFQVTDL
jgi:chromosome segregation ATPase